MLLTPLYYNIDTYNIMQMLMQELDQCYYCLYKYPSSIKKSKSNRILEHSAEQV